MSTKFSHPIVCPILIGRTAEMETLHLLLAQAQNGVGQIALVSGEARRSISILFILKDRRPRPTGRQMSDPQLARSLV